VVGVSPGAVDDVLSEATVVLTSRASTESSPSSPVMTE
jgi:hypothetical protein